MKPALAGTVCRNSVPMAAVAMNPSMNQGNATLRLPPTSVTSLWRLSHQMATMIETNTSMSTRESFMMFAMVAAST